MIERVLEPEIMDSEEEAAAYDAMDHAEVNERFAAEVLAALGDRPGDVWLDLGVGTAQIPIAICRRAVHVRIVGVDLADSMIAIGKRNVEAAGLSERIELRKADAKRLDDPDTAFDAVISNSIIHHLPDPTSCFAEMVRVLKPGGAVFVRDLLRPEREAELAALVATYAGNEEERARRLFEESLRASLTAGEVRAILEGLGVTGNGVTRTSDRHWTWTWRKPATSSA